MSGSRELFGGAITATLPITFLDASNFRQVPDTQEVYLSPDSGISIIVEVLESVSATDLREAAGQHFDSLAHDNDAKTQSVIEAVEVSNDPKGTTPNPIVLYGTQTVQKFNTATVDEVRILLALYRVPQKNVDLVMTMNAPMTGSDGDAITEKEWGTARDAFNTAARSLRIVDYGLFA